MDKISTRIDTVVFDLGGVLIDWNPEYVFRKIFPDERTMRYFFENICTHEWNLQQDAGRPLAQATEERVALFPEWEEPIRAYYGRWEEMLGGPIEETVALLERLRQQGTHRLLALTNWSAETFPVALERYEFLHWFEGIVVSGQEGVIKPDERIYRILIERYDVQPARAVFIDDNAVNARAAALVGMDYIHFTSPQQLARELARRSIFSENGL
ncbi:MAG: hydrolase [Saprospiraceae bacterium]|nr:MAG: hydrolase [Saprospiraceae bacterium]